MIIEEDDGPAGAPAWMATFADLMSLLMCFFVLLLSFSEMDLQKYKRVAGSMEKAFGVQQEVKVMDIPKGTSIIAQEFSPGRPQPTAIKTVNQFTTETTRPSLRVGNPDALDPEDPNFDEELKKRALKARMRELEANTRNDANKLREILKGEILEGKVDIESSKRLITVRIREAGSFPSASATLHPDFKPVISTLSTALQDIEGKISVEGHSDNIPITTARFKSNWDLSSSRALSVTHELIKDQQLENTRFMVVGRADTQPYRPNNSPENRAQNRRVEIVIRQDFDDVTEANIEALQDSNPSALEPHATQTRNITDNPGEPEDNIREERI